MLPQKDGSESFDDDKDRDRDSVDDSDWERDEAEIAALEVLRLAQHHHSRHSHHPSDGFTSSEASIRR